MMDEITLKELAGLSAMRDQSWAEVRGLLIPIRDLKKKILDETLLDSAIPQNERSYKDICGIERKLILLCLSIVIGDLEWRNLDADRKLSER
jgi:hypothetical protein